MDRESVIKEPRKDDGRRTLWFQRVDWTQVFITTGMMCFFLLVSIFIYGQDGEESEKESGERSSPGFLTDHRKSIALIFIILGLVSFTATRIVRIGTSSLYELAPAHSVIGNLLQKTFWAEFVSPIALGLYSVALLYTPMSYLDPVETICGPERDFVWNLSVGDKEHYTQALGLWLGHMSVDLAVASAVFNALGWPSGKSPTSRWFATCGVSLVAFGTGVVLLRPCVARMLMWGVLFYPLLALIGFWVLANAQLIFRSTLDDVHFELPWYVLMFYLVATAPVGRFCLVKGC